MHDLVKLVTLSAALGRNKEFSLSKSNFASGKGLEVGQLNPGQLNKTTTRE